MQPSAMSLCGVDMLCIDSKTPAALSVVCPDAFADKAIAFAADFD